MQNLIMGAEGATKFNYRGVSKMLRPALLSILYNAIALTIKARCIRTSLLCLPNISKIILHCPYGMELLGLIKRVLPNTNI